MGDILKNLNNYKKVRDINFTKQDLIQFEEHIVSLWENGKIKAPVHLSHGNEDELIEGRKMTKDDILLFRLSESVRRLCAYARDFGEILLNLKLHDEMISRSK